VELLGLVNYITFFLTQVGIYAVLALGLNVQWGYTGQINIGVAAFFSIGAYTAAIVTTSPTDNHLGGFGMPFLAGILIAMVIAAVIAFLMGMITLNLRGDYLAIASIGIAEIVRLFFKNEAWLTNGVRGIPAIPKPLSDLTTWADQYLYLLVVAVILLLVFIALQRLFHSPWVRVLRAIRANERATAAAGKSVLKFRVQAFVVGSVVMSIGGALYAHFVSFISPGAFTPMFATFVVWVMLIAGGSGNNRGALLGALVVWAVWSGTEFFTAGLEGQWATRASAIRIFLIGLLLEVILISRPQGLLPEKPSRKVHAEEEQEKESGKRTS
jgi:branched-chain amino acid transport system permease protein